MHLCIDCGNSNIKIGIFDNQKLVVSSVYNEFGEDEIAELNKSFDIDACILCSVRKDNAALHDLLSSSFVFFINLSHQTPIPVSNRYASPETLGNDRLAAIVGAVSLYPEKDILVIDAGTAITYDFVTAEGVYTGGNIAPGLELRAKALHEFTDKLPLVTVQENEVRLGVDTRSAIASGILWGLNYEIEGYISYLMQKYPDLLVLLTGGSTFYFDGKVKNPIFAETKLVLIGLNRILQYNVQK